MPLAMPGQEGDAHPAQPPDADAVAGLAEGRIYVNFFNIGNAFKIIQPATADNPDFSFWNQVTSLYSPISLL